jgi:hypothetical protein
MAHVLVYIRIASNEA